MVLGLACALLGGGWAQATPAEPADVAASAPAESKGAASGKSTSKGTSTAKADAKIKSAKSAKSAKNTKGTKAAKAEDTSTEAADKPVAQSDVVAKPELKAEPKTELKAEAKSDTRIESKPDVRQALTPPPGTMMGAYGQSLMRNPAPTTPAPAAAVVAAPAAVSVAAANTTPSTTLSLTAPTVASAAAAALPATALMGAAGGNANESVARFLQQRGLVAQAATAMPSTGSGLLNSVRDRASDLVLSAMNFLGVPYKRGGSSISGGFDCSGFTRHIFEMSVGLVLPRRADEQAKMSSLLKIKREDLKPGDLVFFNTMRQTFSHVGIYVGEGKFIHSPRAGGAVRVEDMREAYWSKRFTGARRAELEQATPGT